jgi:O-methyltransferase involved in polyketide biosynthesis
MYSQQDLEAAEQQIRHAQHLIELHQNIIDRLKEAGQSTRLADGLMAKMQAGLAARMRHMDDVATDLRQRHAEQLATPLPTT